MIIQCINCSKKFDVNSELIPSEGRTIQCGSCNHIWFFKKGDPPPINFSKPQFEKKLIKDKDKIKTKNDIILEENNQTIVQDTVKKTSNIKGSEIIKYKSRSSFTFSKFLSYIVVIIISFVSLIILIDTFKLQLYNIYPELETLLYSLYETLKDIQLFIKDLN